MNTIYKFRSWSDINHKSILTKNELYFASPESFNDPFDTKLFYDFYSLTDDEFKRYRTSFIERVLQNKDVWTEEGIEKLNQHTANRDKFAQFHNSFEDLVTNNRLGIISFSQTLENTLLWSHYADYHKGIAIGFDKSKLFNLTNFGSGREVKYSRKNDYPKINPINNDAESFYQRVFNKSIDWSYESEFRFLRIHTDEDVPKDDERRKIYFGDDCISEVCLGIKISDEHKKEIRDICESKKIPCIEMVRVPGTFEVQKKAPNIN